MLIHAEIVTTVMRVERLTTATATFNAIDKDGTITNIVVHEAHLSEKKYEKYF
jgi:hypothetical protein